ncbi:MAG: radical SAM protein [Oscillospiraceae bacterium]|jgi:hypothetical protein|nr:radical SAM protein [Oscillospiraceae bacterium]
MSNREFSRYEALNLKIDEDRVLTYSNIACPLDCKYCFANEIIRGHENEDGIYLSEEQFGLLEQLPADIKTVMLGCDTEFLQDKTQALQILKRLTAISKDISVITKLPLDDKFIAELAEIDNTLRRNGNFLTFSVSLACTKSKDKWELRTPSVASRVETLRKVCEAGIDSMVAIRPLIPNIEPCELDEIIDATKDYVVGYYSGPMYLKELSDDTINAEELASLGCVVNEEIEEVHWMPEGNKFLKIESPKLMAYLQNKIEQSGKILFEGAADGMDYLREGNHA